MIFGLEDIVPSAAMCVVLLDPDTDHRCGAVGVRTVLDYPICAECFEAVAA